MRSKTKTQADRRMGHQQGFTLVELMVVIAIVGVMAAIAIPGYLSWKPGYIARGAVSQIQGDLNRAKMRAIETRKECRVVFSTNGYQIFDGNRSRNSNRWGNWSSAGAFTNATPHRIFDFDEFPGVALKETNNSDIAATAAPAITFTPRGPSIPARIDSSSINLPTTVTLSQVFVHANLPGNAGADMDVNIIGRVNVSWR